MKSIFFGACIVAVMLSQSGCGAMYGAAIRNQVGNEQKKAQDLQTAAMQEDIPAWREGRKKIVESYGEKVIDQSFARTFDSIVTAMGALELRVVNMERESGYITASGTPLPPDILEPMQMDAFWSKCEAMGYDPADFEPRRGSYISVDSYRTLIMYQNKTVTFTFSLVKQKVNETKVKARASGINYPPILAEMYKALWRETDRQLYMDQNLDE